MLLLARLLLVPSGRQGPRSTPQAVPHGTAVPLRQPCAAGFSQGNKPRTARGVERSRQCPTYRAPSACRERGERSPRAPWINLLPRQFSMPLHYEWAPDHHLHICIPVPLLLNPAVNSMRGRFRSAYTAVTLLLLAALSVSWMFEGRTIQQKDSLKTPIDGGRLTLKTGRKSYVSCREPPCTPPPGASVSWERHESSSMHLKRLSHPAAC